MSLPLCRVRLLMSMPCAVKKPFLIPRSIGKAFAIGSVSTVMVTRPRPCAPETTPLNSVSVASSAAATTAKRLMDPPVLSVASRRELSQLVYERLDRRSSIRDRFDRGGRLELTPDQAVDVAA